ncbi:MAG: putative bifunctional diguanylate cyclase/phosphodiesterase [Solirubrobacteraceae bacterium]
MSSQGPRDPAAGSPVAEQSLRTVIRENLDGMLVIDRHGVVLFANPAAERLLSQPARTLQGTRFGFPLVPGTSSEIDVVSGQAPRTAEMRVVEIEWEREPALLASLRDVTDRKRTENDLREAEERFRRAFDEAPIGMAMLDLELYFVQVNDALCEITGYSREQLEATSLGAITHPDDLVEQERQTARALADDAAGWRSETRLVHAGQRPVWVATQSTLLRNAKGHPLRFLAQIQDITDRRRYEQRLRHLADHDPLTGLLNRRSFERELHAHSVLTERYGGGGAAIVLDLDHFKFINDTLGHSTGDDTLARAAGVLRSRLREADVLARLGGDEFAVLLQHADAREACLVAEQLLESLRAETVELGGRPRSLAASAGIALFGAEEGLSGEDVLVNADLAMYDAKHAGRDRAELYAAGDPGGSEMKGRVTWAQRIGRALHHNGFVLLAQPIVDLASRDTSQYELLLRMRDEHGDLVPPGPFLSIAERLGMVQEIDRWVTMQAIGSLAQAQARGEELVLEVNLSGLSIGDPELLTLVSNELERTNVPACSLIFEVTETAAIVNITRAGQFVRDLTRLGCRFALDDFGAGYGSFYYLKHLPFDFLKIDGEFVKNCSTSATDRLLIKAVVDIATGMGKETIAEFVDDEQTTRLVTQLGVNYGQGFHLGHPTALTSTQPTTAARMQPPPPTQAEHLKGRRRT